MRICLERIQSSEMTLSQVLNLHALSPSLNPLRGKELRNKNKAAERSPSGLGASDDPVNHLIRNV